MHYAKYGKVQHFKLKLSYKAFELFHVSELTMKPQNWVTRRGLVVERWYRKWRVPGSNPALAKITQTGFFHHLSPSLNNTTLLKMEHRFSQQDVGVKLKSFQMSPSCAVFTPPFHSEPSSHQDESS